MFKLTKPIFYHVLTPLHAGSGSDLGIIDMPIQREKHTGFPKIESSSLKGSIREAFEDLNEKVKIEKDLGKKEINYKFDLNKKLLEKYKDNDVFSNLGMEWKTITEKKGEFIENVLLNKYNESVDLVFGPEDSGDSGFAGALGFSDVRLLLFPVKSVRGVFAWVTCPEVIEKFISEMELCDKNNGFKTVDCKGIKESSTPNDSELYIKDSIIVLEEYTFSITNKGDESCTKFAKWLNENLKISDIPQKLVVLNEDDFKDFVNLSTEVITRTKINNETGTVKSGHLFTEEYLPAETIMYSLVFSSPIFQPDDKKGIFKRNGKKEEDLVMEFFENSIPEVIQIGGNASLGKGIVEIKKLKNNENGGKDGKK